MPVNKTGIPVVHCGEDVKCFLFDAPHAASITCQEMGEPVF